MCRLHRGSDSPAEIPPASEPGRRTTRWTKAHKGGKKSSLNRNQRKLSCSSVQRACHCRGEAHPPEEAAQRHLPVSRRPQFLQQEIDALHADLLLQQLRAQLGEPVTCSLPTAQAHTCKTYSKNFISSVLLILSQFVSHFTFKVLMWVYSGGKNYNVRGQMNVFLFQHG